MKLLELFLILNDLQPKASACNVRQISRARTELAQAVAAYLAEHREQNLTVQMLASRFHVSATYLQETFKSVFGMPVFSYFRTQKMNLAARDLIETQKTVMEIANTCGYDNASKFSQAFREVMHQTPLEYRRRQRVEETKASK